MATFTVSDPFTDDDDPMICLEKGRHQHIPKPTGSLDVLDATGHSRMQWDRNNPEQVAAARARFDELKAKRYLAYRVDASGKQAEVIDKFDPKAEQIIMQSAMVGG